MTTGLNHVTFGVAQLDRAVRFYVDVVGCTLVASWVRGAYLTAGSAWICLLLEDREGHGDSTEVAAAQGSTHVAFSFDLDGLAAFGRRLRAAGGREWRPNRSEGASVYFLDPDGHRLEAHVGSLRSRLESLREAPYEGLEFHGPEAE